MFCGKCGNEVQENEEFCANCGEPVKKQSKKANLVAIVSSMLMIIMIFLPFGIATSDAAGVSVSESLSSGKDGIYFIIIAVCGGVASLLDHKKALVVIGGIACAVTLFEVINFVDVASELKKMYGSYYDVDLKRGIGFWIMILSSVGLVSSPFVGQKKL